MNTTHILIAIRRPEGYEDTHPDHIPDAGKKVDTKLICKICGESSDHHHSPDWIEAPAECVCDVRSWCDDLTEIPPICDNFEPASKINMECRHCEHGPGCHF